MKTRYRGSYLYLVIFMVYAAKALIVIEPLKQRLQTQILFATPSSSSNVVRAGDLLSDLPTPSLLLELSLAEASIQPSVISSLDDALNDVSTLASLDGSIFVHTSVTDTSFRDAITQEQGSGKSQVICRVDAPSIPGGAYLGIGLANHHVGGYYWARGMGMGASLPAHGVLFNGTSGELYWKKRGPGLDATETTEESSNSNDGKRSEWADFVAVKDTLQLIPESPVEVLTNASLFETLLGVRRIGRPMGADPIVETIWKRCASDGGWVPMPNS